MTQELIKRLLDACFCGKRITELMPPLPSEMKVRHMHVIDTIHTLQKVQDFVRVSDVSNALQITTPSVTKLINELTNAKIVKKSTHPTDKRTTCLTLTPLGNKYYEIYIETHHKKLEEVLKDLNENDCEIMIRTLKTMYDTMESHPIKLLEN